MGAGRSSWIRRPIRYARRQCRQYPGANISPIDYDPGVSAVNQLNRIRLMMATAKKAMKEEVTV